MPHKKIFSGRKSAAVARRSSILPHLSRILRNQTPVSKKASASITRKSSGGIGTFMAKALIGAGAVYLSSAMGVWGEPDESVRLMTKIKNAFGPTSKEGIVSQQVKNLKDDFATSTSFQESACYDRSEKYINDVVTNIHL